MENIKLYLIVFLCFIPLSIGAQSSTDWEIASTENNVQISYRWVTSEDGKKAREMKTTFTLDSEVSSIVKQINNAQNLIKWSKNIDKCSIDQHSQKEWDTYIEYNLPWPLNSRDLFTKSELIQAENYCIIKTESCPEILPEHNGIKRIRSYSSEWKFVQLSKNRTRVVFKSITYDEPEFPRWLTDPIIQNKMIASIESLKGQLLLE